MLQGYVLNSSIDGTIQMKSYLAGNPELKLALNEELVVGKGSGSNIVRCFRPVSRGLSLLLLQAAMV